MSDPMIAVEVIRDADGLRALQPEWDELTARMPCEPSTSFEWTRALIESHLQPGDATLTFVLREAGRMVAIAPVIMRHQRLAGPLDVSTVQLVSELNNTHSDILGERHRGDVLEALFRAMASLPDRWEIFRIQRQLESGALASGMKAFLGAGSFGFRIRREQPSYLLRLNGSFEQYLGDRSGKFRNYLRRKTRQLEALGAVRILRAGSDLGLEDAYRDLLAIERRSWKHAHGSAISAVPHQQRYYHDLIVGLQRENRLHLTLLYLDQKPVAHNLGLLHDRGYYYLKTSYDEEYRSSSPATVQRARLIESLIKEGVERLDFPAEPYEWESQWADELRWHQSVVVFSGTARSRLCQALMGCRDLIGMRNDALRVKHVDPRALRAG